MVWKCPNTAVKVRTIEIRQRFGQNKLDWIRLNKMAYNINEVVTYQQRKNRPNGLVSFSEHVQNYPSKISNKINEYRLPQSVCLVLFCKLR